MKALILSLSSTVALLATLVGTTSPAAITPIAPLPLTKAVSVNVVFWDQARGFESVYQNLDIVSEVNPFWYTLSPDGRVSPYLRADGTSYEDASTIKSLQTRGVKILPTIANTYRDDIWPRDLVTGILYDEYKRARHIENIVKLTVEKKYDGINLDYENLAAEDRAIFTTFVQELAAALHAKGKLLNVAVYAKTSEPGTWGGPQAQNYRALGQAADKLVIMLYNYHWGGSVAGPITPPSWERQVLALANSQVPAKKISHSIPLFGYDWVGKVGQDKTWQEHTSLAKSQGLQLNWNNENEAPWFKYGAHEVWYENALSFRGHLSRSVSANTGTINLWRLGGEDPDIWKIIRSDLVQAVQNSVNQSQNKAKQ